MKYEKCTTQLAKSLFANCDGLEEIVLPDTVTKIDDYAFAKCVNLKKITIPESVTSISETSAFSYPKKMTIYGIEDSYAETYAEAHGIQFSAVSPISITLQPESKIANAGEIVTFEVKATGTGLTYRWQYSTDNGVTWKNSAAKSETYRALVQEAYDGYMYRCIVTDKNGKTVTSNAAMLTVV